MELSEGASSVLTPFVLKSMQLGQTQALFLTL